MSCAHGTNPLKGFAAHFMCGESVSLCAHIDTVLFLAAVALLCLSNFALQGLDFTLFCFQHCHCLLEIFFGHYLNTLLNFRTRPLDLMPRILPDVYSGAPCRNSGVSLNARVRVINKL